MKANDWFRSNGNVKKGVGQGVYYEKGGSYLGEGLLQKGYSVNLYYNDNIVWL